MKIALVHDYLVQYGGAERVLESFVEMFPDAPIYTLLYDKDAMHGAFADKNIITSSLQKVPFARRRHRIFPPLMPSAIESFDFSQYDIVLSDSSSFAKGIITRPETLHISYVHTPMRYAWDDCQKYTSDFGLPRIVERFVPFLMNPIRLWDYASADRVDCYIANSHFVARRIKKYYHKNTDVIHPPVSVENFSLSNIRKDYFLMVGRLITYKRHDVAVEAFNQNGLPLKIIGRGPEIDALRKKAKPNIEFLGRVDDKDLPQYYAECKGFIFPQEEDFGIVAIEAMASGRPLIAYCGGDIVEHMEENVHGVFFNEQTPASLMAAIDRFQDVSFDQQLIRAQAEKFDKAVFQRRMKDYVEKALAVHLAEQEQYRRGITVSREV
jgi:glycosyltransferase involved in cell wall biosynthesis